MEVFRLSVKKFADLSGMGGMFASGRWHQKGQPILYTAGSRSLAALERFVHESPVQMPPLVMMTIYIPDDIAIKRVSETELPNGWDAVPDADVSRHYGSTWLRELTTPVIQLPSAIVACEYNFLVNPMHPDSSKVKVIDQRDFYYDSRLKKMMR
ncbi:RES family NAD+ phosphorylase [Enterovibrio nigricans]|uniref:RES domain-containing protein n=1 Tax=Enterovibrio nigricans DSM 22720 TaxID=1121868 RepID=A0A1T4WBM8_9GAMM|nr:RES family NAD+ phosphorylase [Enterovibrio nigricans]PKF48734.1 RES domain-containing protein [Enterovibrio nigricans]SKA74702.1 RES domain-containing protein [Enterovibrio nigricans DSM 22720]